jgi:hypothetical protein
LDPIPGQTIIPRNYGTSPNFLSVNLNVSKTFTFFGETDSQSGDKKANILGIPVSRRPLYFTFSVQIENLLNRTNPYLPEGNLSSPFFGQSYFSAGSYGFGGYMPANRIIKPSIIFSF